MANQNRNARRGFNSRASVLGTLVVATAAMLKDLEGDRRYRSFLRTMNLSQ